LLRKGKERWFMFVCSVTEYCVVCPWDVTPLGKDLVEIVAEEREKVQRMEG